MATVSDVHPLLAEVATKHRHSCPRQVLGIRMGLYAGEVPGLELPRQDKREVRRNPRTGPKQSRVFSFHSQ
jgi:formylmethanofuran dehydrogenase subunit E